MKFVDEPLTIKGLAKVLAERERQDIKWGEQNHSLSCWVSILGEEFGELCQAVNETELDNANKRELGGIDNVMTEASHVAAVACEIIERCIKIKEMECHE